MTGFLFLFFSVWIGFIVEDKFDFLEKNFWAKFSFAIIIGTLLSTWLTFSLSLLLGFTKLSLYLTLLFMALYLIYSNIRQGNNIFFFWQEALRNRRVPFVHLILLLFVMPFFIFGVWEKESGDIAYLGNYTDLSYHLSIISAFTEQTDFLPDNPQSAGAKMSYHFLVNFHSAILHKGGFDLLSSVIIPQILFSFALATMLYYFYKMVLKDTIATFFSAVFLIMGHVAFFNLLFALCGHLPSNMEPDFTSWHSIKGLLLYPFFNFLDPVINYFHPQRPFLFAFPLALILLSGIYRMFLKEKPDYRSLFFLALLLGLTPLFHIHTFLVFSPILVVAALFMRGDFKRTLLSLLPLILAAGQIWFILSQPKAPGFSGFDVHSLGGGLKESNLLNSPLLSRVVFWIRAAGFPLVLGVIGFIFYFLKNRALSLRLRDGRKNIVLLIFFTVPFMFFLLINFYRFSPSWGDSNKFFLYFEVMLALFAGKLMGSWYEKNRWGKLGAGILILISAIGPSSLEAYVVFSKQDSRLFSSCDVMVADWIKSNTAKDAVFLTSDDVIHYVPALAGRRVVDGAYTWNTGFKKPGTEMDVRRIYSTGKLRLIRKYNITHILVGPRERKKYDVDEKALAKYNPVYERECKGTRYKIFDVKKYESRKPPPKKDLLPGKTLNAKKVFLSDMEQIVAKQDFKPLRFDVNINGLPIILNEKKYPKGLGTHAFSEVVFQLNKNFSYFESDVGLDDTEDNSAGSIVFVVYVDGKLKYRTPVMRWDTDTCHIKVNINGANILTLMVEDGGDGDTCDHASWGNAMIY